MTPYRFKKNVIKTGRILLFAIFIIPQFYLLFGGQTSKGEFIGNKSNSATSVGTGVSYGSYQTYIYGYQVDEKEFTIEASDLYISNFEDVQIVYNTHYPDHSAIKSFSGLFLMRTILLICSVIVFESIVSLFLKDY